MDYRRLAISYWLLDMGGKAAYLRLYTLRFTLLAPTPLPLTSNLSPYRLIYLPFGSVLTQMPQADAGAVRSSAGQNRRSVRQNIISSTEGR